MTMSESTQLGVEGSQATSSDHPCSKPSFNFGYPNFTSFVTQPFNYGQFNPFIPMYNMGSVVKNEPQTDQNNNIISQTSIFPYDFGSGTSSFLSSNSPSNLPLIDEPRSESEPSSEREQIVPEIESGIYQKKEAAFRMKRPYSTKTFRPGKCIQMSFLSGLAFLNSGRDGCCLREIYAFVVENFEGFDIHSEKWKKTVRHSLCTFNDIYSKAPGEGNWMFRNKDLFLQKLNVYMIRHPDVSAYGLKDPGSWTSIRSGIKGIPRILGRARKTVSDLNRRSKEETNQNENLAMNEQFLGQVQYYSNLFAMSSLYAQAQAFLTANMCGQVLNPVSN